jgi:hypothetical protein
MEQKSWKADSVTTQNPDGQKKTSTVSHPGGSQSRFFSALPRGGAYNRGD